MIIQSTNVLSGTVLSGHPLLSGRCHHLRSPNGTFSIFIFSSSELVEPHFNPVKGRLVALKEEAKWQVFVRDCEHWILLIYCSLIL